MLPRLRSGNVYPFAVAQRKPSYHFSNLFNGHSGENHRVRESLPAVAGSRLHAGGGWSGRRGSNPRPTAWKAVTLPLSYSRLRATHFRSGATAGRPASRSLSVALSITHAGSLTSLTAPFPRVTDSAHRGPLKFLLRAKVGGEGRTRTFEAARATDLQSAAFDRFATSPGICLFGIRVFDAYFVVCYCQCFLRIGLSSIAPCESGLELAKGFEPPTC